MTQRIRQFASVMPTYNRYKHYKDTPASIILAINIHNHMILQQYKQYELCYNVHATYNNTQAKYTYDNNYETNCIRRTTRMTITTTVDHAANNTSNIKWCFFSNTNNGLENILYNVIIMDLQYQYLLLWILIIRDSIKIILHQILAITVVLMDILHLIIVVYNQIKIQLHILIQLIFDVLTLVLLLVLLFSSMKYDKMLRFAC